MGCCSEAPMDYKRVLWHSLSNEYACGCGIGASDFVSYSKKAVYYSPLSLRWSFLSNRDFLVFPFRLLFKSNRSTES